MRSLPEVPLSPCPPEYARLLAYGWDTVQEAYNMHLTPAFVEMLEEAKQQAASADKRRTGLAPIELGGTPYRVRATGTHGFRWQIECDDYLILIANPETDWPL